MGGQARRHLQIPAFRGRRPAVGAEEEEQQHDLRETQPGHEVRAAAILPSPEKTRGEEAA